MSNPYGENAYGAPDPYGAGQTHYQQAWDGGRAPGVANPYEASGCGHSWKQTGHTADQYYTYTVHECQYCGAIVNVCNPGDQKHAS